MQCFIMKIKYNIIDKQSKQSTNPHIDNAVQ